AWAPTASTTWGATGSRLSTMKKLINDAESVVADALAGLAAAHPDLGTGGLDHRVGYRASPKKEGRVAVISGG
ncbi:Glycerone kinase, partial [human gut metagenome]